ncbi:hypothetical protein PWT90_03291 [Aphanocladium album]|nr:hypothetical protein PWT90_03291 [Aphanocladium album]
MGNLFQGLENPRLQLRGRRNSAATGDQQRVVSMPTSRPNRLSASRDASQRRSTIPGPAQDNPTGSGPSQRPRWIAGIRQLPAAQRPQDREPFPRATERAIDRDDVDDDDNDTEEDLFRDQSSSITSTAENGRRSRHRDIEQPRPARRRESGAGASGAAQHQTAVLQRALAVVGPPPARAPARRVGQHGSRSLPRGDDNEDGDGEDGGEVVSVGQERADNDAEGGGSENYEGDGDEGDEGSGGDPPPPEVPSFGGIPADAPLAYRRQWCMTCLRRAKKYAERPGAALEGVVPIDHCEGARDQLNAILFYVNNLIVDGLEGRGDLDDRLLESEAREIQLSLAELCGQFDQVELKLRRVHQLTGKINKTREARLAYQAAVAKIRSRLLAINPPPPAGATADARASRVVCVAGDPDPPRPPRMLRRLAAGNAEDGAVVGLYSEQKIQGGDRAGRKTMAGHG